MRKLVTGCLLYKKHLLTCKKYKCDLNKSLIAL